MYILIPGRHHLLTHFQFDYLDQLVQDINKVADIDGQYLTNEKVEGIIFAVTSANHSNTRRNPIAFHFRAMAIQEFAQKLDVPFYVYGINDVGLMEDFASYTLKVIAHDSDYIFDLNPSNTVVICSTPVLKMYRDLNFRIYPAELKSLNDWTYKETLPWELVEHIAYQKNGITDSTVVNKTHPATLHLWKRYRFDKKIQNLFQDELISADGDITTSRDYNSYVRQMDEIAVLKFEETVNFLQAGRIGDIGCAVGSWIKLACEHPRFQESDFYGIEIARHLFDLCNQRKHNGEFSNPNVFFSMKNAITGNVFQKGSMNSIHTSSLTHEIESYGSRQDLIDFIANRFEELCMGGVWVNRDVIGPANKSDMVLMLLDQSDGRNEDYDQQIDDRESLENYLNGLSTHTRFLRFATDFRQQEAYQMKYDVLEKDGNSYISLRLQDACEFMSKKDYTSNWQSEMHETFCHWSYEDWMLHLTAAGYQIDKQSKAFTNEWIVENRLKNKVQLFDLELKPLPYPVSHALIIARKI